ncbi:hypothetical protein A3A63_02530 [Candidatus Gottesmanbacteria bacterium RIFCSPLOWO2_01_FULL_46_9]|uniref:Serine aminopeptidase S33 domain-containing protein n=1 Tax=Candidatus Gottesmanbacteria bacterium RIFCSPLOWO2_01_FULL_46_9 TaxID=1798394 RepID=A0A1F6B2P7_9BACT|nr:MAG: hypothetical protein A3A63_02530 [Candidatus Gottesmanbacteria bacterium RIFCSPLOWO2_01_FULL_46_9]
MKPLYLVETITKDKLIHQGIFYKPTKSNGRAILWVHGLTGKFYGDVAIMNTFAEACDMLGFGFASFNTRGHDMVTGFHTVGVPNRYRTVGAGYEKFEECVYDIDAAVSFLVSQGFSEVVLVGHSTGANKVCFYAATQKNPHVIGVVLSGSLSDRLDPLVPKEKREKDLSAAKNFIKAGRGNELMFGFHFFPMTPKRYISIFEAGSTEDTFDYGDAKPKMTYFSQIQLPVMVVLPGADEYADRPIEDIKKVFDDHATSKRYHSTIIPGAVHKLHGKESEAAMAICDWVMTI